MTRAAPGGRLPSAFELRPPEVAGLGPPGEASRGRRAFLRGAGLFLLGFSVPVGYLRLGGAAPRKARAARSDLPAWVRRMLALPAADLVRQAGEFERLSLRDPPGPRAGEAFERLLALAIARGGPLGDAAAACALRSLERIGRLDLVAAWVSGLRARRDLPEARRELTAILDQAFEAHRWLHR